MNYVFTNNFYHTFSGLLVQICNSFLKCNHFLLLTYFCFSAICFFLSRSVAQYWHSAVSTSFNKHQLIHLGHAWAQLIVGKRYEISTVWLSQNEPFQWNFNNDPQRTQARFSECYTFLCPSVFKWTFIYHIFSEGHIDGSSTDIHLVQTYIKSTRGTMSKHGQRAKPRRISSSNIIMEQECCFFGPIFVTQGFRIVLSCQLVAWICEYHWAVFTTVSTTFCSLKKVLSGFHHGNGSIGPLDTYCSDYYVN